MHQRRARSSSRAATASAFDNRPFVRLSILSNTSLIVGVAAIKVSCADSDLETQVAGSTDRTLAVKTRKALDEIGPDLDQLEVGRVPSTVTGSDLWSAAQAVGTATLRRWSMGQDSVAFSTSTEMIKSSSTPCR